MRGKHNRTGETATFIRTVYGEDLTPHDGLYTLIPWMKENNWEWAEYEGDNYHPWRVIKKVLG